MDRQALSDESDRISYQPKRRKDRSQKYRLLAHNSPMTRLGLKEMRLVFLTNRDIYHVHTNTPQTIININQQRCLDKSNDSYKQCVDTLSQL